MKSLQTVIAVDPSVGGDISALSVLELVDDDFDNGFATLHNEFTKVRATKSLSGSLVQQADEIEELWKRYKKPEIGADVTGLGVGMAHILESRGIYPMKVTITSGMNEDRHGRVWHIGRTPLLSGLVRQLEQEKLKIMQTPHSEVIRAELTNFRNKFDNRGRLKYESVLDREISHSDFLFSIAIGVLILSRGRARALKIEMPHRPPEEPAPKPANRNPGWYHP